MSEEPPQLPLHPNQRCCQLASWHSSWGGGPRATGKADEAPHTPGLCFRWPWDDVGFLPSHFFGALPNLCNQIEPMAAPQLGTDTSGFAQSSRRGSDLLGWLQAMAWGRFAPRLMASGAAEVVPGCVAAPSTQGCGGRRRQPQGPQHPASRPQHGRGGEEKPGQEDVSQGNKVIAVGAA